MKKGKLPEEERDVVLALCGVCIFGVIFGIIMAILLKGH